MVERVAYVYTQQILKFKIFDLFSLDLFVFRFILVFSRQRRGQKAKQPQNQRSESQKQDWRYGRTDALGGTYAHRKRKISLSTPQSAIRNPQSVKSRAL